MSDDRPAREPSLSPCLLRRLDQLSVAILVTLSLALLATYWLTQGGSRGRLIEIEQATPQTVEFQLDINVADWHEWTLLPGIGETLARRIVHSRQVDGPFRDHDDLQRVSGIGPKTVARVKPYLLPVVAAEAVAGASAAAEK